MLTTKFALEKYHAFPYIAWTIVFCFSLFVYHLTQTLAEATRDLRTSQIALQNDVQLPVTAIDFDRATTTNKQLRK